MNDQSKLKLLREAIGKQREFAEEKKALNEEKRQLNTEKDEEIMNGGTISVAKELFLKILKKEAEIKELNAKIKRVGSSIEQIIMGEDEYIDEQVTIEDLIENTYKNVDDALEEKEGA